ncbi:hypothetical protein ACAG26_06995 [Mycobacterium sp. pUA109]|uniref:hypothetical protein n=1 Tax=Mycobacterium sp. pUA109 TaxID=3238982 RepID=UPI00351BC1F6
MSVAGLVLGIIGTVLAVAALTWHIVAFLRQNARPKLAPLVGVRTESGLYFGGQISEPSIKAMVDAAAELPGQLVIGVEVTNAGRAPLRVSQWTVRADPSDISVQPAGSAELSPVPAPCEVPAGETCTFLTDLDTVRTLVAQIEQPQQIRFVVGGGGRRYRSKPVDAAVLAIEPEVRADGIGPPTAGA